MPNMHCAFKVMPINILMSGYRTLVLSLCLILLQAIIGDNTYVATFVRDSCTGFMLYAWIVDIDIETSFPSTRVFISLKKTKYEPAHDKTYKMACAPSEDSDQPGHPPSLIRVFAICMKKAWVLTYPLSA